jgi:hypothetical protein
MRTNTLVLISCSIEAATGLGLVAAPNLVASLLLGVELPPSGEAVARVGGFGLFSLAVACWPQNESDNKRPIRALFAYNLAAACYLTYLRIGGEFTSLLLLPASGLHALLGVLLARPAYRNGVVRTPIK